MLKFKGKKWNDMNLVERAEVMDTIYRWAVPIRILVFPMALVIKLYKWTYNEEA